VGLRSPALANSITCLAMMPLAKSSPRARHFERDTQNLLGFGIDIEAV
jgi:hypothetical protein